MLTSPIAVAEKSIIKMRCTAISAGTVNVEGDYEFYLVKNPV
jgi:hypothetical protein